MRYAVDRALPSWSPDGAHIVFTRVTAHGTRSNICIVDADGSDLVQITNTGDADEADWGTHARRIASRDESRRPGEPAPRAAGGSVPRRGRTQPRTPLHASHLSGRRWAFRRVARSRFALERSRSDVERSRSEVEGPSESFEDFYRKEYWAVVGLAYALSGEPLARRTWHRRPSSPPIAARTVSRDTNSAVPGCDGSSRTSPFRASGAERPRRRRSRARLSDNEMSSQTSVRATGAMERRAVPSATAVQGRRAVLPRGPAHRRRSRDARHVTGDREATPSRRTEDARASPRDMGGRAMTLDARARRAAQSFRDAVEETDRSTPGRSSFERFDRFRRRKQRNARLGATWWPASWRSPRSSLP